jgi:metal-responsive CopG/Arc/MetJ family transcriptional regulator
MKTAVSIPDSVFEEAERFAKRTRRSRSDVYSQALAEYVARHATNQVTEAMDQTLAALDETEDQFAAAAGRKTLRRNQW